MNLRLRLLNLFLHTFEKRRLAYTADPLLARQFFHYQRFLFHDPPYATYLPDQLGSVPAIWVSRRSRRRGLLLYFHGGAYVMGSPETHRGMVARLASLIGVPALLPDYRKAPEHPFPAAFQDAWTAWQTILDRAIRPRALSWAATVRVAGWRWPFCPESARLAGRAPRRYSLVRRGPTSAFQVRRWSRMPMLTICCLPAAPSRLATVIWPGPTRPIRALRRFLGHSRTVRRFCFKLRIPRYYATTASEWPRFCVQRGPR